LQNPTFLKSQPSPSAGPFCCSAASLKKTLESLPGPSRSSAHAAMPTLSRRSQLTPTCCPPALLSQPRPTPSPPAARLSLSLFSDDAVADGRRGSRTSLSLSSSTESRFEPSASVKPVPHSRSPAHFFLFFLLFIHFRRIWVIGFVHFVGILGCKSIILLNEWYGESVIFVHFVGILGRKYVILPIFPTVLHRFFRFFLIIRKCRKISFSE
jgi:hypothetical protein